MASPSTYWRHPWGAPLRPAARRRETRARTRGGKTVPPPPARAASRPSVPSPRPGRPPSLGLLGESSQEPLFLQVLDDVGKTLPDVGQAALGQNPAEFGKALRGVGQRITAEQVLALE